MPIRISQVTFNQISTAQSFADLVKCADKHIYYSGLQLLSSVLISTAKEKWVQNCCFVQRTNIKPQEQKDEGNQAQTKYLTNTAAKIKADS